MRIVIATLALLFLGYLVNGQANIKIGYNIGFPQLTVNDDILSRFTPVDSEIIQPFGATNFMHGIQIGARYRFGNQAIELGWENLSKDRSALSYRASSDSFTNRDYGYAINSLTFGIDNYIGKFGIGSTLLYQKLRIDRKVGNNDLGIVGERKFGLRLQFIWQVQQSSFVSLMIKPYYQFSLGEYDLTGLANDLGVTSGLNTAETPKAFGITLVFYNGKQ